MNGVGRLFWKFFFFFWLAQLTAGLGVGLTFWLRADGPPPFAGEPPRPGPRDAGPPPAPSFSTPEAGPPAPDGRPPPGPHRPRLPYVPLVAGLLVSLLFAALLAWYCAKPIRSLRAAFAAAARGRLGQRLAPAMGGRRDELADLGRDFDRMAEQLKQLMDGQRRLLHDVSHELRSPLARLQAAIGLARQQPERSEELLSRIELESVRMDGLVSELLTLSRLEAGMEERLDETVDLCELLVILVEDARFEAQARACTVEYPAPPSPSCLLTGSAELLHRALENVVRNALKHAPPGGRVGIALLPEIAPGQCGVRICDNGPGVPADDLAAIFRPFFRGEGGTHADGHGLGLAIARRIVELHGGSIVAANRDAGGLCVSIALPRGRAGATLPGG